MFNTAKHQEFFDPSTLQEEQIHVIGCGAIGAGVSELLTRLGIRRLFLWDEDVVEAHNLANQFYRYKDINTPKTKALSEILKEINPEIEIVEKGFCTPESKIKGYIFMCIDNIETRKALCEKWYYNPDVKFVVDVRMRMIDGQIFAADWSNTEAIDKYLNTMNFSHEDALKETPVSACGMQLSVVYAPRTLAAYAVANFTKFINTKGMSYHTMELINVFNPFVEAY